METAAVQLLLLGPKGEGGGDCSWEIAGPESRQELVLRYELFASGVSDARLCGCAGVRVLLWSTALRPAKRLSDHIIELSETSFASGGGQQQISDLSFRGKDLDKPSSRDRIPG
jgi:hypothetical protein